MVEWAGRARQAGADGGFPGGRARWEQKACLSRWTVVAFKKAWVHPRMDPGEIPDLESTEEDAPSSFA